MTNTKIYYVQYGRNMLYLYFGDVSWFLHSVVEGLDSTGFDPLRVISVGVLSIDLLKNLPSQVVYSLGRDNSNELLKQI